MLVTDGGDEKCWWQLWYLGDSFGHFGHQRPLSFYIDVANIKFSHQNPQIVTNFKFVTYHDVTNLSRRSNREKIHTLTIGINFEIF